MIQMSWPSKYSLILYFPMHSWYKLSHSHSSEVALTPSTDSRSLLYKILCCAESALGRQEVSQRYCSWVQIQLKTETGCTMGTGLSGSSSRCPERKRRFRKRIMEKEGLLEPYCSQKFSPSKVF